MKTYPNRNHSPVPQEAELQAELYHQCKLRAIICRLEVSTPCGRIDAAIEHPSALGLTSIIECKKNPDASEHTKQFRKYAQLNVPLYKLTPQTDIPALITEMSQNTTIIPWSAIYATKNKYRRLSREERALRTLDDTLNYKGNW